MTTWQLSPQDCKHNTSKHRLRLRLVTRFGSKTVGHVVMWRTFSLHLVDSYEDSMKNCTVWRHRLWKGNVHFLPLCSQNCKKVSWAFIIAALKSSIITLNMWCKQVKIFHTSSTYVRTSPHSSSIVALRAKHDIFTELWCVLFKFASSFLEFRNYNDQWQWIFCWWP